MNNFLKLSTLSITMALLVGSCNKNDDAIDATPLTTGSIKLVITLASEPEDWKFNTITTLTPGKDFDQSKLTYVNTSFEKPLGMTIPELEKDAKIHTFITSPNAKALTVSFEALRGTSTKKMDYKMEIFINDKFQDRLTKSIPETQTVYLQGIKWSIDDGLEEL